MSREKHTTLVTFRYYRDGKCALGFGAASWCWDRPVGVFQVADFGHLICAIETARLRVVASRHVDRYLRRDFIGSTKRNGPV